MWLRRLSLLMALSWMALLFYLSSQPSLETPMLFPGQDKLFHAVAYGVLGSFLLLALPAARGGSGYGWAQIQTATVIASLYGISDEFHQSFVPGRQADVLDWVADTTGALLAALLLAWLFNFRLRNDRSSVE